MLFANVALLTSVNVNIQRREILFAGAWGLAAIAAILSMPLLVAAPKLLFGRSLSAIAPSLFPYITLSLIAVLSVLLIVFSLIKGKDNDSQNRQTVDEDDSEANDSGLVSTGIFFALLTGYGLLLKPLGFLISSFLVIGATSLLLGNRNLLQILLLAFLAPICLYLLATRAMLVSLPELNQIELLYAHSIDWLTSRFKG